jgi:hypothetical protein
MPISSSPPHILSNARIQRHLPSVLTGLKPLFAICYSVRSSRAGIRKETEENGRRTRLAGAFNQDGDLGGISGFPVVLGLHTIHSARSPVEQYSPGAFNSSHFTIGSDQKAVKSVETTKLFSLVI